MSKKKQRNTSLTISSGPIENRIYFIRGMKVMLDSDLAELYGVPTSRLNEQVTRNPDRFPEDFMFQLSREEALSLRSQNAILKSGRGQQRKYLPRAFTEHGILMLSSVLRSERAVQVNIAIMRAFVRLRELATSHAQLTRKLNALEEKYDVQFKAVFDAIRRASIGPAPRQPLSCFHACGAGTDRRRRRNGPSAASRRRSPGRRCK